MGKVGCESHLHVLVDEGNVGESELQGQVVIVLDHVLNGEPNRSEGVLDNILAHLAGGSNGHWVSVDHAEALLED